MKHSNCEVSVVVLTYDPIFEKLTATLRSIVFQKNVELEIIITDDGSKENYFAQIEKWFESVSFHNYILIASDKNTGTCQNYLRGVNRASGKYVKAISPGDLLYGEYTLAKWASFMEKHQSKASFGDVIYYSTDKGVKVHKVKCQPQRKELYAPGSYKEKQAVLNYICLSDAAVGCAFLVERNTLAYYLKMLIGKVKYAEDSMFRIMVCDNVHLDRYGGNVVLYEYGTGISTGKSEKWAKIIHNEMIATNSIIKDRLKDNGFFNLRMKALLSVTYRSKIYTVLKYLLFPSLSWWQIVKRSCVHYSKVDVQDLESVLICK